ncbi:hypothetical protein D4764_19G0004100 [Takifugu flavidus]|uniref:Lebercilin domain-containing protein n=1 Tax=Takifugu flavidus TaxID=433684 RepID=A0A5C6NLZ5_9TELE|nr:hypothetical protein D4764_19G0004100 [Takifugu flavidus]
MQEVQEETINSSSSSSSSATSSSDEDMSRESIPSERTSQCSDSNPSERSDREEAKARPLDSAASQKPKQPKASAAANKKKERQKPRAGGSTAKKNPTLDDANLKRLASQELQIKSLNNLIVELQNENDRIKVENRTLRQVQGRLQLKTKLEKTLDEVTAQHVQDTHVLNEQLKRYKKQMRAAEKMIRDKDERLAKQQSEIKKNEESLAHMKGVLAEKGLETRDELLREIDRQKRLAQDADEKAAEVGRKAEEINSLHQKILLAEKRKTEEATMKVIYLLKTVQDLNRRLMIEEMVQRNMNIYAKAKAEKEASAEAKKT